MLRGKHSDVAFLHDKYVTSCRRNDYTTTLHAISSCIVKLSQLTEATKVYRGNAGLALPDCFLKADSFGVKGGIELGFMSTTLDSQVARHYAERTGSLGLVLEIQQGMVSRGANLSLLSQYPHEREILFTPLTGLEVESSRVEGSTIFVQMRPNVNTATRTIEQVIARRRTLLSDMGDGMQVELSAGAALSRFSNDGREAVLLLLRVALKAGPLAEAPEAYNDDATFVGAVQSAMQIKRDLAADAWGAAAAADGGGSVHLPLFYALQLLEAGGGARRDSSGHESCSSHLNIVLAAAMASSERQQACGAILDAMLASVPPLWTLSAKQADAFAEAGREMLLVGSESVGSGSKAGGGATDGVRAQWAQVEQQLLASVAGGGKGDGRGDGHPGHLSEAQLETAVRNGLRCGLPRNGLAQLIESLWRYVDARIGAAGIKAEELNRLLGDAVGAGLSHKLGPAIGKLARLYASEGRGIPILANLPIAAPALEEVLSAFSTHKSLCKLILKGCELDADGVTPLAAFLSAGPPRMYEAYLNGNPLIGAHAAPLFEALAANRRAGLSLSAVSMPSCGVTDDAAAALARLLEAGEVSLVELNLKDNPLSEAMKETLHKANAGGYVQSLQL